LALARRRTTAYASVFAQRRGWLACGLAAGLPALGGAGAAAAATPGGVEAGAPVPTPVAAPPTGGAIGGPPPRVTRVTCRVRCAGPTTALPRATLDLRGRNIAGVDSVSFLGGSGDADDLTVAPARVTRGRVLVRVPAFARSGPLAVTGADGTESPPSRATLTVQAPVADPTPGLDVAVRSPKVFVDGARRAAVAFALRGTTAETVDVELRREADGATVERWTPGLLQPGAPQTITWDGTAEGRVQPPGRYAFRVSVRTGGAAAAGTAVAAQVPAAETFELLDHQFPIRGAHRYGTGAGTFGGGRGHQGYDVFAACGTPLVAARGGRVKFEQFHSRAGHYLVIDGEQTEVDYAYMHLREAALVDEGDRVRTGQLIGYVGATGRASGCHLHLELWSAPGWYDGGRPVDPLPHLRAWDATS